MSTSVSSLVPDLQPYCRELLRIAGENRLEPRITSARRSLDEQRGLYDRYLRGANPYPVAPPGTSAHETGEAFDMLVTPVEYLPALGALWKEWGGEWGGNRDPVHFQLPGAPSPELLQATKGWMTNQYVKPQPGGSFYKLADFLSSFVPYLGTVQLVENIVSALDGHEDLADYYLNHPAEAIRDLLG